MLLRNIGEGSVTFEGRAQSLLRPGRHPWRGGDRRRPPAGRRRLLLLASCAAALVVAPQALADPTSTTPAPDPNPPAGAAPDPYTPKAPAPKTSPAPVHTVPHVYSPPSYSPPSYSPPSYTPPAQTVQHVTPRAVAPVTRARPVVHHHAPRTAHKPKARKPRRPRA